MSQNISEVINVQSVFAEISEYLKNEQLFERLLNILHEEPNYKRLLKTGEKQFFDAPNESSLEAEADKSRLSCAKLNYLIAEVENDIDKIVREKFQGEFLDNLKDEVLQAILQLSSDPVNDSTSKASASPVKSQKSEPKPVLPKSKHNNSDSDANLISFDDVSSVHTSDLSSFEDEISLSSDDEFGEKKRLSLREVQEQLEKSQLEKIESEEDDEQNKSNEAEDAHYNSAVNGNGLSSTPHKSQRRRKPNFKYTEETNLKLLKRKTAGKISKSSRSMSGDKPRKRGRPRKHST